MIDLGSREIEIQIYRHVDIYLFGEKCGKHNKKKFIITIVWLLDSGRVYQFHL